MTLLSLFNLLREYTHTNTRELDCESYYKFQQEYFKIHGHYKQELRSRDNAPFPGHDTQVDVYEEPVDRKTKTTHKGYKIRRWVRGKEITF